MSYSLNSLKGGHKGDARSLDYGSYGCVPKICARTLCYMPLEMPACYVPSVEVVMASVKV